MKQTQRKYIFTSKRLGFRGWDISDVDDMAAINTDESVMEYFPGVMSRAQTLAFIDSMNDQLNEKGYCYFAVDRLDNGSFIGFIGLSYQTYPADFTPCVDIGWRLKQSEWNNGFATEGARRCLEYALHDLNLKTIYAVAPKVNTKSEAIMIKIGMTRLGEFEHPKLLLDERLRTCVVYCLPLKSAK